MKVTQIYLNDDIHLKMKQLVALMKDMTNQKFITKAVEEKIEREGK